MIDLTNIKPNAAVKTNSGGGSGWLFFIIITLLIGGFYIYNKRNPDKTKSITDLFDDQEADEESSDSEDEENQETITEEA